MLVNAGVSIETVPARIEEQVVVDSMLAEGAPSRDIADVLAELKAMRISSRRTGALVLGSDQVLDCEGHVFTKATNLEGVAETLTALSGKTHSLLSAAVFVVDSTPVWRFIGTARLTMRTLSSGFIDRYVSEHGEDVLSSVGCYHIEGAGAQLFARIEGDLFTIMGLPLLEVLAYLRVRGVLNE